MDWLTLYPFCHPPNLYPLLLYLTIEYVITYLFQWLHCGQARAPPWKVSAGKTCLWMNFENLVVLKEKAKTEFCWVHLWQLKPTTVSFCGPSTSPEQVPRFILNYIFQQSQYRNNLSIDKDTLDEVAVENSLNGHHGNR